MANPGQEPGAEPREQGRASVVDRRMIIIGVPLLAGLAAAGAVTGYVLGGDKPAEGGADGDDEAPTPSTTPTAAEGPYPTDTMLVRLDEGESSSIYSTTPGSGDRTKLADSGHDALPQWSHDRQTIVYIRNDGRWWQIVTMRPDGSDPTVVADRVGRGTRVCWSPDDKQLAYVDTWEGRSQLFTFTLGDEKPVRVTRSKDDKDDPTWSPSGDVVAMWINTKGNRQIALVQLDEPDATPRWLTKDEVNCADPCWSPDGKWIAYTRNGAAGGQSDIWMVRPDGTDNQPVTSGTAQDMDPTWSPDSKWIAFTRGRVQEPSVWIARPDGTEEQQLTVGGVYERHASWS
ncbi:TolB family protein [Phytohabitans flavus]|uniref:TolB family protein n=1 Tax=Phytohabitans flavus TaxID=1076124 RepID=UPI003645DAF9